ncbi:transcriptional regulator, IclR family [Halogranum rubrum]|uniref:Transcriptional regulator, IclR family n=1 Tax=Halogranum rubrum TaxID=553466 RepID=A0A1I4B7S3_9EURY|nr:IclR family transcriptional regulator [Halogranum rubrum]SFK64814.1 transcriptional regulator, IclR family [Halogranum rubrum]
MSDEYPIKAVHTCFRILTEIHNREGAGVSELARSLDLSKAGVHKHLQTLSQLGYLSRDGDEYCIALGFLGLGLTARSRFRVYQVSTSLLRDLAETSGYVASLSSHQNGNGICVAQTCANDSLTYPTREGDRISLHATAAGKAMLAYRPVEEIERYLTDGLDPITPKTITNSDEFRRELQSARDRRVVFDREESREGWQSVASPITDLDQVAIAAVSVSGPVDKLTGKRLEEDITGLVVSTAKSIENRLL